jgi:molybdopterin synthase sulfur carrier subunit
MARVFLPSALRALFEVQDFVETSGRNVREVVDALDSRYPGIRDRLCKGDELRPGLAVTVDGAVSTLGMLQRVSTDAEIHFLPTITGGCSITLRA